MQVERLEQVVEGALLHRLDGRVGVVGRGDEDDGDAGVDLADPPVDLQPREVGQAEVEQDHVRRPRRRPAGRRPRRCGPRRPRGPPRRRRGGPASGSGSGCRRRAATWPWRTSGRRTRPEPPRPVRGATSNSIHRSSEPASRSTLDPLATSPGIGSGRDGVADERSSAAAPGYPSLSGWIASREHSAGSLQAVTARRARSCDEHPACGVGDVRVDDGLRRE